SSNTSDSTFNSNACKPIHLSTTSTGLVTPPEQVVEELIPKESSAESAIPYVPVNADLTPGSVFHLAHLFDKAEKTGRKKKLRWYYYSEKYEKKIVTLRSENNISDQMAKNIYILFKGIGIDKIGVVTS
ncbi:16638_t:CDS:2, partial [Funneliformis geosporum]